MANDEHVTKAGYAVTGWNRWRDSHLEIEPDLSGSRYPDGKLFEANCAQLPALVTRGDR